MDNKKLNEKESLELIAQMIQNTKSEMAKNAGSPFLIWGYMTVIVSLLIWYLLKETGNYQWQWLWFLLPAVSFPATLWFARKQEQKVKTYIDRIIGYVWIVFGLGGFLISSVATFYWKLPVLFIVLLIMGMGTALTGLILKMKLVIICGTMGALFSLGCLFIHGIDQILLFGLAFIFMMIVPGHYLNGLAKNNA